VIGLGRSPTLTQTQINNKKGKKKKEGGPG